MANARTRNIAGLVRTLIPALLWLGTAALMGRSWQRDPYDPTLTGTAAYGHNGRDALAQGLAFSLGELLIYYAFARPWRRTRAPGFVYLLVIGLVLFGGWSFLQMILLMHAGGIQRVRVLWLWILDLLLVIEILRATQAALERRARTGRR
jgi:hypothetical protein